MDPATGARKSYYGSTEIEASERAFRSYTQKETGNSLYEFYAHVYLPTVLHRSQKWQEQIGWAMDKYILPSFGHLPIDEIKRPELQRFFNSLTPRYMNLGSAGRVKIVMSGVMNLAEADEIIPRNPLRFVRIAQAQEPNKTALSFEELKALLNASHDAVRPFVLLCGFAGGLRPGEALAVTRAHLRDGLQVRQQVLQPKGGCIIADKLKTTQTKRDLPLPPELSEAILNCNQKSGIYVCSDSKGGYLTPNNAHRELEIAIKKAGIPRITPHELRHTFISLLENELECPPAVAAALAGKRHRGVTSGYSHAHKSQMLRWLTKYWETAKGEVGEIRLSR